MALRQLLLVKRREILAEQLEGLRKLDTGFLERRGKLEIREKEVEAAIDEITPETPEEDKKTVEGLAEELIQEKEGLEKEIAAHEQAKAELEKEVEKIDGELEELNKKPKEEPAPASADQEPETRQKGSMENMNVRGKFFGGISPEVRSRYLAREDTKEFLQRAREFIREKRGVTGAELTIPEYTLELLRNNLYRYSALLPHCTVRNISGKGRQNIVGEIPEAIWTEACASLNELTLQFNQVEVDGYKVGGYVAICNSTLEDSDENLANEILDQLARSIAKGLDKALIYGTGKKMPLGIVTRLAQTVKPENWGANAPEWKDLHTSNIVKLDASTKTPEEFFAELILALSKADNTYSTGGTFWAMSRATRMELMSKAINFNSAGALVAGINGTMPIEGGKIVEVPSAIIPDGDIVGGYGSVMLVVERKGAALESSEHAKFIQDQTVFKGTARYDGMPVFGGAFVLVNIHNQTPTTTTNFAPDKANP